MSFAERFASMAESQVGVKEGKVPNEGLPHERYSLHGEQALPWCAKYVRWCMEMASFRIPWNRYEMASVAFLEKELKARRWQVEAPARGDIVIFKNRGKSDSGRGRHVGIVVEVCKDSVRTVEGNLGDAVARASHKITDPRISGFYRIPKEEAT